MSNNEEGIIVKSLKENQSEYKPNERSSTWLKLKSEYLEEINDTLDLVVIGGYFGEKKRHAGGHDWTDCISVFLMGIIKNLD